MRETDAPQAPSLYEALVEALSEDTDPYGVVPFTIAFEPTARAPAAQRLRTHEEYQAARAADETTRRHLQPLVALRLDVGAWIPDDLLLEDTVVVDVYTLVAAQSLVR